MKKVAIVYDKLTTSYGGAEFVLECLLEAFPQADLYTSVWDKNKISFSQKNVGDDNNFVQPITTSTNSSVNNSCGTDNNSSANNNDTNSSSNSSNDKNNKIKTDNCNHKQKKLENCLNCHPTKIRTSFLQKLPDFIKYSKFADLFRAISFELFDLDEYEVVICVSSGEAKGVITKPHQTQITYLLTPPRYLYTHQNEYIKNYANKLWPLKTIIKKYLQYLQKWDQSTSFRNELFIPISQTVWQRAKKYYPHAQISPPVFPPAKTLPTPKTSLLTKTSPLTKNYWLFIGRLVWYKQADLCLQLPKIDANHSKTTIIIGQGQQESHLHKQAQLQYPGKVCTINNSPLLFQELNTAFLQQAQVIFIDRCSDHELAILYQNATALLMPGVDDFGLTAIEALSQGCPVIINQHSGISKELKDKTHGIFIKNQDPHTQLSSIDGLVQAIHEFQKTSFIKKRLIEKANEFSKQTFIGQIKKIVYDTVKKGKL